MRKLKKREKGLGGRGKLTDATIDHLQNFFGLAIRQNTGSLSGMKAGVLASLFHVASSKTNLHFPHCPTGPDSWCKYNADKANNTNTYKPGPGLSLEIVYKIRPIYQELSQLSQNYLNAYLNAYLNESFNAMIWDRIPKTHYVSLTQLQFGVYDAVAYLNICMKASILISEKLGMIPGVFTLQGCKGLNARRLRFAKYKVDKRNKLRRQVLQAKKLKKNDKLKESGPALYKSGAF